MLKQFILLVLLLLTLNAGDKVEIYASSMDSQEDIVNATGGVSVLYDDYILTADSATYDRDSGDLELHGHVRVSQGSSMKILGQYAKLNIAKKERLFRPFYMSDEKSRVWLSAAEGTTETEDIEIESGVLSGCNPIDPIWKMEFTSSDYNSKTKWLNIYNPRLYVGDIPVFYSPYFGYSLDNTRRTGLLMPSIGYSSDEGLYFEQPIYIAPQSWWDLEFRPQVRTNRGMGLYETFRFVESKKAKGEFKAGYFSENTKYFEENQLVNSEHYGFNFNYENQDFLNEWFGLNLDGQAEIYADMSYMNDVDYINLSTNDAMNTSTAKQILSRINLFYNGEHQYIGTYFKYYQDLTKESNTATLQKLPTLQYHYYLDTFLKDKILYSLDVQSNNIDRTEGTTAIQTDINLPVTFQTNLFNEYLNISYQANLYAQHTAFAHTPIVSSEDSLNDGYVLRNYHTLTASTQLTRGYDDFSHVMSIGVSYNKAGTESKNGYYKDNYEFCADSLNKDDPRCEFYNITSINEEAQIDFTQYIYDDHANEILYHRLAQRISYGDAQTKYGELENELDYKITKYLSFYNNMLYNYDKGKLSKIFNQVKIKTKSIDIGVSHLYKDSFIPETDTTPELTSYLTSSVTYRYNSHYSFNGIYNYDTITHEAKNKEIGFLYKKRCWDFGLRYSENRRPILTTTGDSFVDDRYVYLTLVLKPLMQSSNSSLISYKLPQSN